jgi:hypothetical protein
MTATNFGQPMEITAQAVDSLYTDAVTDRIGARTIAPLGDRFVGVFSDGNVALTIVPGRSYLFLRVVDFGATPLNRDDRGLLVLFRGGAPARREAAALLVKP